MHMKRWWIIGLALILLVSVVAAASADVVVPGPKTIQPETWGN